MGIVKRWVWRAWATLAGVLLLVGVLLCAWAVRKPWLPGLLDLELRGAMWLVYAILSLAASCCLIGSLWDASRGRFRWYVEGLAYVLILLILCAILFPVAVFEMYQASYADLEGRDMRGAG